MTTTPDLTVPVILEAMAAKIGDMDEVAAAFAKKPPKLTVWPSVLVLWGGGNTQPTTISSAVGFKSWDVGITVRIFVSTMFEPDREGDRINRLITPIVDLFEGGSGGVRTVLPGLAGHITTLEAVQITNELKTDYNGVECYVADIAFRTTFKRRSRR
jgi:hypothetical protein